jgi:Recombination endonuclease VII
VLTKQCPSCGESKPAADFGRNRSLKDGLSFYCLACNRERNRAWYRQSRRTAGREVRDHSWVPEGFRWCPACEQAVPHDEYMRASRTSSGFGSRCKACHNAANSEYYLRRTYQLTKDHVAEMRRAQGDRCAICGDPAPQHLDHDHETGGIRELLCQRCNHGLGLFRDDPALLHAAAFYVDAHRERQLLARLEETFVVRPGTDSRPGSPPVGSQRRPGGVRGKRSTGRSSGERRQGAAGEAGA